MKKKKQISKHDMLLIDTFVRLNWTRKFRQWKEVIGPGGLIAKSTFSQKTYTIETANKLLNPFGYDYHQFKADIELIEELVSSDVYEELINSGKYHELSFSQKTDKTNQDIDSIFFHYRRILAIFFGYVCFVYFFLINSTSGLKQIFIIVSVYPLFIFYIISKRILKNIIERGY